MKGSRKIIRLIAVCLLLAMVAGICGCGKRLPFQKKEEKTQEEYQQEAEELSYYLLRRILIADYDSVRDYIKKDEREDSEPIIRNMDVRLYTDAVVTVQGVQIDPTTYETKIEYRISLNFDKASSTFLLQMVMSRSGSSWKIANALTLCVDMDNLNQVFIAGKTKDEQDRV